MRIACIGGGPAGLYFALLMKRLHPAHRIAVIERNRPHDTFGWGVVFSDATMDRMRACDRPTADAIEDAFNHWDDVELHFKGRTLRSGGHGFVGIGRKRLLDILQARCEELGVELRFDREVRPGDGLPEADLVVGSDGIHSVVRQRHAEVFRPEIVSRPNRYLWLGTTKLLDAFNFVFERTEHGWFQAHAYRFDAATSTFIVEAPEDVWRAHGLDRADGAASIAFCERLFARRLEGHPLLSNARHARGSAWLAFQRVTCERWSLHDGQSHVALMGDAVHTAHFAIGSGTKLALEDAMELALQLDRAGHAPAGLEPALARYQAARSVEVARLQNAAWNAMEWFEVVGRRYADQLEPEQLMYSMLTRSQRISHENLRLRDPAWLEGYERWFAGRAGAAVEPGRRPPPPMFTPLRLRGLTLANRVVVSPMAMYSAREGVPGDFHLVHLGARALGGAALVYGEMTCVSPDARITPGCAGLWSDEQEGAWRRIVEFVHASTPAAIGLQLGHAGRKGATHVPWEGEAPLEDPWPLVSASPIPWAPGSPAPREMTRPDMERVTADFAAAAARGARAGFDVLELHCAHGYLLSSFLSPLTNRRTDGYGGPVEGRLRYPLEVFRAVRSAWPQDRPISVRLSCHDWFPGGNGADEAVAIARAFREAGADLIDCSSGQVWPEQHPRYGRMWQTPFSDRIRNEVGIPTVAVGAIFEADHVNMVIAAGRADLCAVARPHLADPAWTLHEAARIGWDGEEWPRQYLAGRQQYETNLRRGRRGDG